VRTRTETIKVLLDKGRITYVDARVSVILLKLAKVGGIENEHVIVAGRDIGMPNVGAQVVTSRSGTSPSFPGTTTTRTSIVPAAWTPPCSGAASGCSRTWATGRRSCSGPTTPCPATPTLRRSTARSKRHRAALLVQPGVERVGAGVPRTHRVASVCA
jgi:hypothetical protein